MCILVRLKLTLVIELLIFLRQRASSSLDSRAHCTQVAGGCKYLHERGRCPFKPMFFKLKKENNLYTDKIIVSYLYITL